MNSVKIQKIVFLGVLFLLSSCGPGIADYPIDLGDGYYQVNNGYIFKGEKKGFSYTIIDSYANPLNDYAYNKDFILAEEISTRSWYWIIDKNKDIVYGPTDFETYLEKKEEFGVRKLTLRRERKAATQKFLKRIYES